VTTDSGEAPEQKSCMALILISFLQTMINKENSKDDDEFTSKV